MLIPKVDLCASL